jgi:hypothetical protein
VYWVVQSNLYGEEGFESLDAALERLGLPYSLHKVVPFVGTLEPDVDPPPGPVIVMGSYTLARVARERGWSPGAFLDNLDFQVQREHWGELFLNHDAQVLRFADVPEQLDVADTPDGLKIIEINNLNSAGFYKADMMKLVMALERIAGMFR